MVHTSPTLAVAVPNCALRLVKVEVSEHGLALWEAAPIHGSKRDHATKRKHGQAHLGYKLKDARGGFPRRSNLVVNTGALAWPLTALPVLAAQASIPCIL